MSLLSQRRFLIAFLQRCPNFHQNFTIFYFSAYYYYSTFAVTNNLKHTVILSWNLQSKASSLVSVASKTHNVKPGTKEKEIKIIFTSSAKLTDEELRAINIKVSAKKVDKTTPVFINKNEFASIPITLREDRQALLQFSKAGKYFVMFDEYISPINVCWIFIMILILINPYLLTLSSFRYPGSKQEFP